MTARTAIPAAAILAGICYVILTGDNYQLYVIALVGLSVVGSAVGSSFARSFTAPGTESQRATDLLKARFPARAEVLA